MWPWEALGVGQLVSQASTAHSTQASEWLGNKFTLIIKFLEYDEILKLFWLQNMLHEKFGTIMY